MRFVAILLLVAGVTPLAGQQDRAEPLRVDTEGVTARILFEAVINGGHVPELVDKYKLRVTEIAIAPGGRVGDHNHLGPGIRQMTEGRIEYILPDQTVTYSEGDFFFETGDVSHRVEDESGAVSRHLLFEILPIEVEGASLILPRDGASKEAVRSRSEAATQITGPLAPGLRPSANTRLSGGRRRSPGR